MVGIYTKNVNKCNQEVNIYVNKKCKLRKCKEDCANFGSESNSTFIHLEKMVKKTCGNWKEI
jgi:hypothetical protein